MTQGEGHLERGSMDTIEIDTPHGPARRRQELEARLAQPHRRRALVMLTVIIGLTLATDGASQIAPALTVPTATFVPDSTAARIVVLGTGLVVTMWYFRLQKEQRERRRRSPVGEREE